MAAPLALHSSLHHKVNPLDLDKEGFVVSKEHRDTLFAHQESDPLAGPFKLSRKVSLKLLGVEIPRSTLFVSNKIFSLYRDQRISREDGSLGCCHNGKVRLAQDLASREWVAVKIITEGTPEEAENLQKLGRLVGHIPPSKEGEKGYLLQPLLYGTMGYEECIDPTSTVLVFLSAFRELQRFHQSGLMHGDCGIHNFMYNRENNQSTIMDFETSQEDLGGQYFDNERMLSELLRYLELNDGFCNSIEKRKNLLDYPILFDMAVKLFWQLCVAKNTHRPIEDLAPRIEWIQSAYDCEYNPSEAAKERYFSHFSGMQNFINKIKQSIVEKFEMPVCDYIEKAKKEYSGDLENLVEDIEEYKSKWLSIGQTRLTASELDELSPLDKILHYTACKERVQDRLLKIKNGGFGPWERKLRKEEIVDLIGGAAVIEECERQLKIYADQ